MAWAEMNPTGEGDCRKLVTLRERSGMIWVGIRAWNDSGQCWMNNGTRESEKVLAWQDLPLPAYSDGLMTSRPARTYDED